MRLSVIIKTRVDFLLILIVSGLISLTWSCKESDDVAPVITLNGADTVTHTLNEIYVDEGASAIDETDGDISSGIYVDNTVNIDKTGIYDVTYKAVDQAGNEATPVVRTVIVINSAWSYNGIYELEELQIWPEQQNCNYSVAINSDSTVNYRLNLTDINCEFGQQIFIDIIDTVAIAPFQILEDSIITMSIQGSGIINDSSLYLEYTRSSMESTSLWQADFVKQP